MLTSAKPAIKENNGFPMPTLKCHPQLTTVELSCNHRHNF